MKSTLERHEVTVLRGDLVCSCGFKAKAGHLAVSLAHAHVANPRVNGLALCRFVRGGVGHGARRDAATGADTSGAGTSCAAETLGSPAATEVVA